MGKLPKIYKEFEKQVFQTLLDPGNGKVTDSSIIESFTAKDKKRLIETFQTAEIFDPLVKKRIDELFSTVYAAQKRLRKGGSVETEDALLARTVSQTNTMVEYVKHVEIKRERLFERLENYLKIVRRFLSDKNIMLSEGGSLQITVGSQKQPLSPQDLSSGEKHLLIQLTQAFLWENEPIVFVVDEPETSLHLEWQEILLESLKTLAPQIQIIAATHSPTIVGSFRDKLIHLSNEQ